MPDDDHHTSFAHAIFAGHRDAFEREFERFLASAATPVQARRAEAEDTVQRLRDIIVRMRRQGVL